MTFVSALFSRTHFNANYFAVLNESFKVISLFSYQSSLFVVFATAFIFYQKHLSLSTTFLFFFVVVSSDSLFILSPAIGFVNNFFIFLRCRFKRQPVYLITSDRLCQQLFSSHPEVFQELTVASHAVCCPYFSSVCAAASATACL